MPGFIGQLLLISCTWYKLDMFIIFYHTFYNRLNITYSFTICVVPMNDSDEKKSGSRCIPHIAGRGKCVCSVVESRSTPYFCLDTSKEMETLLNNNSFPRIGIEPTNVALVTTSWSKNFHALSSLKYYNNLIILIETIRYTYNKLCWVIIDSLKRKLQNISTKHIKYYSFNTVISNWTKPF